MAYQVDRWREDGISSIGRVILDQDSIMLLNKPSISSGKGENGVVNLTKTIRDYINNFTKSKGFVTKEPIIDPHQIVYQFDNESIDYRSSQDNGGMEINVDHILLYLEGKAYKNPSRKQFMIDSVNELFKGIVTILATEDATAKRKMDPDVVNLAGGPHDNLAKLYTATYAKLVEAQSARATPVSKPGLLSGIFGRKGGKTRKTRKLRSRKQKKTRKH